MSNEENTRRLVLSIIDFLQTQLSDRYDLSIEDRDNLRIAIDSLEIAYDVENVSHTQRRSLLDMFSQVANPVSIQDKLRAEALKNEGNGKMAQELYQQAEEDYSRAIDLDPWNAIYFCNRAAARMKLGQFYDSIEDCRRALVLNPDYTKAYGRMGQAYVQMNRPRSAATCFQRAVRLEPDNPKYRNNLEIAQRQAMLASNMGMDQFMQNIFSLIAGRGPDGQRGLTDVRPFVILTEPHRERDCTTTHQTSESANTGSVSETDAPSGEQTRDIGGNQDESGNVEQSDSGETVHFRVIFGIPRYGLVTEGNANENTEDDVVSSSYSGNTNEATDIKLISEEQPKEEQVSITVNSEESEANSTAVEDSKIEISPSQSTKKDESTTNKDETQVKDSDPFEEMVKTMAASISQSAATSERYSKKSPGIEIDSTHFNKNKDVINSSRPIGEQLENPDGNIKVFNAKPIEIDVPKNTQGNEAILSECKKDEDSKTNEANNDSTDLDNVILKHEDSNTNEDNTSTKDLDHVKEILKNEDSKTNEDNSSTKDLDPVKGILKRTNPKPPLNKKEDEPQTDEDLTIEQDPFKEVIQTLNSDTEQCEKQIDSEAPDNLKSEEITTEDARNDTNVPVRSKKRISFSDLDVADKESTNEKADETENQSREDHKEQQPSVGSDDSVDSKSGGTEYEKLENELEDQVNIPQSSEKENPSGEKDNSDIKNEVQDQTLETNTFQQRFSNLFRKSKSNTSMDSDSKTDEHQISPVKVENSKGKNSPKETKDNTSDENNEDKNKKKHHRNNFCC